jgi:protein-S-isoprenylcysteine O-methyltransferase Ste14
MKLKVIVGNGGKITLFTLSFMIIGLTLNFIFPDFFRVSSSVLLRVISFIILIVGIIVWIWSVVLILTKVPRKELMIKGPYSIVKHPLYTGVALLVLPWLGFLFNTWIGVVFGIILYIGTRIYSPGEEEILANYFGAAWNEYCNKVKLPWL